MSFILLVYHVVKNVFVPWYRDLPVYPKLVLPKTPKIDDFSGGRHHVVSGTVEEFYCRIMGVNSVCQIEYGVRFVTGEHQDDPSTGPHAEHFVSDDAGSNSVL